MTDRIDLDELADATTDGEGAGDRGDWFWGAGECDETGDPRRSGGGASGDLAGPGTAEPDADDGNGRVAADVGSPPDGPVPHVPRATKDRPVGIPVEGGGAGGGPPPDARDDAPAEATASGPHGGDADDMTMAITYRAVTRLADPARVLADAARWADWVGIVGDVDAPVINKFQRDHHVDVDFFNGTGTVPGERLAEIDHGSMFFAERMVVVGVAGEDDAIAAAADWEFVPLETAADEAGWALEP